MDVDADMDTDTNDANDNDTCQTKHDCIGSLPNEPKRACICMYFKPSQSKCCEFGTMKLPSFKKIIIIDTDHSFDH